MKKVFLLLTAIIISLGVMAQKGKVTSALSFIDQGALDKAKENLDQAVNHEKSKDWYNTYFAKGRLYQAVFESEDPKYSSYCSECLEEAYNAYLKALELDNKGSVEKRLITNMIYNSLALDLFTQGSQQFEEKNFEEALKSFTTQIKITESDQYAGAIDSGMYYNAGLAAINSEKYTEAINYFEKCAEMHYMGITPYYQIYESMMGMGDTVKAEAYLLDLPNKFPDDNTIVLQLIDLYLKSNRYEEALKYINIAKENNPDNYSLYFATGIMLLNQEKFDDAIVEFKKSMELKPDHFESYYGMGASHINKAADMIVKANEIMDVQKYSDAIDEANAVYEKALPYMEKAYELNPKDEYTMRSLQELYYRLRVKDPSLSAKYEEIKAKLDSLKLQQEE
jgi:tetratricopeptide (TPR) repeat protein